jgi:hypothetical protein
VQSPSNVIVSATTCTNSNFTGSWTASADALSGLKNYSFSIGTAAGLSDILAWANGVSPLNQGGLTMNLGSTYYLNVYSTDNVDNTSDIISAGVECSDLSYYLKAFWRLNEATGDRLSQVGAHTLTDNNSVLSAAGKIGNAAVFDSASNESLSKASHADLASADESFTLSAWVSLDNTNDNNPLIAKWSAPANNEYLLEWKNSGTFRFWVKNSSVDFNVVGATNGTWYHVVAWYEKDNLIGISVNNQAAQTAAQAGGVTDLGNPFEIGHNSESGIYLKGKIDAVRILEKSLAPKSGEASTTQGMATNIRSKRYPLLDAIRGVAILLMIFFHTFFDLTYYGVTQIDFMQDPFWFGLPRLIVFLFFSCVGISLVIVHGKGMRWLSWLKHLYPIALGALAVTIGTYYIFLKIMLFWDTSYCRLLFTLSFLYLSPVYLSFCL